MTTRQLIFKAFIWAEQDRRSLADAWGYGTKEGQEALAEAKALKRYRLKRFGKSQMEAILETAESKPVIIEKKR